MCVTTIIFESKYAWPITAVLSSLVASYLHMSKTELLFSKGHRYPPAPTSKALVFMLTPTSPTAPSSGNHSFPLILPSTEASFLGVCLSGRRKPHSSGHCSCGAPAGSHNTPPCISATPSPPDQTFSLATPSTLRSIYLLPGSYHH